MQNGAHSPGRPPILKLAVMGESLWLDGFRPDETAELHEWFAGAIEPEAQRPPSLVVRMIRCDLEAPAVAGPSIVRHRANIRPRTRYLDGSEFDQSRQIRDITVLSESADLCSHLVDGALLFTSRDEAIIVGRAPPPLLLADLVENWLLWRAREDGLVMAHASGWLRDGVVEMFVGSSGDGKTTELLRRVGEGAQYFANDRIALRVEGGRLLGRSFPEPINVGVGAIRALGLDLPTFGMDDLCAIRVLANDVLQRWRPDFSTWRPISRVHARNEKALDDNVYWDGDPEHPFWNRALRPRELTGRPQVEAELRARLTLTNAPPANALTR